MILFIVMATVAGAGLLAIWLAEPPHTPVIAVWSDDVERRLLNEGRLHGSW